jgi:hypothetical protein
MCYIQERRILIGMKSSCVGVAFLKQSFKTWIGFYLAGIFLVFPYSFLVSFYHPLPALGLKCEIKMVFVLSTAVL